MSIAITKNMKRTIVPRVFSVEGALEELKKYSNNYELMNDVNRVYGDIDCKNFVGTEEEFWEKNKQTHDALVEFVKEEPCCFMTATNWNLRVISWRIVFTKLKMSIKDNKQWAIKNVGVINLPQGVSIDSSPYAERNQKIRMLGSSKDGENRPLVLVQGTPEDSLITHIEGCNLVELPKQPRKSKKKEEKEEGQMSEILLERLVMNIRNDDVPWEHWYKIAQAIYNVNGSEELFLRWSSQSSKHLDRDAELIWKGLKKRETGGITAGSLYYWSFQSNPEEHNKIILDHCEKDSYAYQKMLFEETHFKVVHPTGFGYHDINGDFHMTTLADIHHQEKDNLYENFIETWLKDPHKRVYQGCVFKPKLPVPKNIYNLWNDFGDGVPGDISVIQEVLMTNCNYDKAVFDYVERWFAWIVQFPSVKTKTCLVFQSDVEGAGKDTAGNFFFSILGREYGFNTLDPENEVFGRFNSHLKKCLFIKFEEAPFIDNKAHRQMFKGLITTTSKGYEEKGHTTMTLDCYFNIMLTTNNKVPAMLDDKERRMVLIKCSEDKVGQMDYWKRVHAVLDTQEARQAYLHYLLNLDLTGWNAYANRPITQFYEETKLAGRPYHARFFQNKMQEEESVIKETGMMGKDLLKAMNAGLNYEINETALGRDLKPYLDAGVLVRRHTRVGNNYRMTDEMEDYLKQKGWWSSFF
jgi:hypothetical protein